MKAQSDSRRRTLSPKLRTPPPAACRLPFHTRKKKKTKPPAARNQNNVSYHFLIVHFQKHFNKWKHMKQTMRFGNRKSLYKRNRPENSGRHQFNSLIQLKVKPYERLRRKNSPARARSPRQAGSGTRSIEISSINAGSVSVHSLLNESFPMSPVPPSDVSNGIS